MSIRMGLNLSEISQLVRSIPAEEFRFKEDREYQNIIFRACDETVLLSLSGSKDLSVADDKITLESASVSLVRVNDGAIVANYHSTFEVRDLFYETRGKIREHRSGIYSSARNQLESFGVMKDILDKTFNDIEGNR